MKTTVNIGFREPAGEVARRLPDDLSFLEMALEDIEPGHHDQSVCSMTPTPYQLERIIEWGRELRAGKSNIRIVDINELYGQDDLDEAVAVEIFMSGAVEDDCEIKNYKQAYEGRWECPYCIRIAWKQVADVEVSPRCLRGHEVQRTINKDWLVSSRVRQVLERRNLSFRSLKGTTDFTQVIVQNECQVDTGYAPVILYMPCPVCGRPQGVDRDRTLEGDQVPIVPIDHITICQERPLTVRLPETENWGIAKTDLLFDGFYGSPKTDREIGQRVRVERRHFAVGWPYYYFAETELLRELFAMNIKEIAFRPVFVVSA